MGKYKVDIDVMKQFFDVHAIATRETQVRDLIVKDATGDVTYDGLGSVIVHHPGCGPKILFMSHMDEVGFMVQHISPDGYIYVIPIGNVDNRAKSYQKVVITTQQNESYIGLLQTSHDRLYIDIGVDSSQEIIDRHIAIGDMVTFASETCQLNDNRMMAKAVDDRIGCYILSQLDRTMSSIKHPNDLYFGYTSSEEVGARGGKCVSDLVDPDIIFVIDVASTKENIADFENHRKLGQGYLLVQYDKTMIPNPKLITYLKELSAQHNIAFQCDMFAGGGTDGALSHLFNGGKLAVVLGVPLHYCHGSYSIFDVRDMESLMQQIEAIIATLDAPTLSEIKQFD